MFVSISLMNKSNFLNCFLEPEYGETALHQAACANNEAMISHLLSLGADPNVSDSLGKTPSMCAADYGHIQSLKLLAEAHADLTGNFDTMLLVILQLDGNGCCLMFTQFQS